VFVKKIRPTDVVRRVFDGARRRRTEEEEKEKNAKISALLPFSVSSSLLQQTYHPRATIFITLVTIT
jgi:hypothetical protein